MTYCSLVKTDGDSYAEKVKRDGSELGYVPSEFVTFEMCLDAVRSSGQAIHHVPKRFLTEEMYVEAAKNDYNVLRWIPPESQTDRVRMAAIASSPHAFGHMSPADVTPAVCVELVGHDGMLIADVPASMRTREVVDAAMENTPLFAIEQYVPAELVASLTDAGVETVGPYAIWMKKKCDESPCVHHVRLEDGRCAKMSGVGIRDLLASRGLGHPHFTVDGNRDIASVLRRPHLEMVFTSFANN